MWSSIRERLVQIDTATGIELVFSSDEQVTIHACTVRLENNTPVKKIRHSRLEKYADLQALGDRKAASAVFSGRGVLVKKLGQRIERDKALSAVLPQAKPEEFYTQVDDSGPCTIVALARKTLVDKALAELQGQGITVLDFSLGFTAVNNILPFISPDADGRIETSTYTLTVRENTLWDFESGAPGPAVDNHEYLVGRQYLQGCDLLPYAAAVALIAGNTGPGFSFGHQQIEANREEYKYRRYLQSALVFALVFLFTVLLANFLLYDHYFNLNKGLTVHQQASQKEMADRQKTGKTLAEKETFFRNAGWLTGVKTSFLADRLASFLPEGTGFTALSFFPPGKAGSANISFTKDTISISGWCNDPYQINLLMNNIKTLEEVQTVNLTGYSYRKDEQQGNFSLELIIKP